MTAGPFRINLSSNRRAYLGPVRLGLALLSLLLAGLIVWDYRQTTEIRSQTAKAERALERLREQDQRVRAHAQAEGIDVSDTSLQKLPAEVAFANQLIEKRAFSWTHFLGDLEGAVPAHIAIHNIRLDVKESAISMTGSALSLKALTTLIISLEDHPAFHNAVLMQHHVLEDDLVEFSLTVKYTPTKSGA